MLSHSDGHTAKAAMIHAQPSQAPRGRSDRRQA